MKILITGSSGMLGHDLTEVLKDKHELILTTSKTMDITDKNGVIEYLSDRLENAESAINFLLMQ